MAAAARFQDLDYLPGSVGDTLRLIRTGASASRSELARVSGLAPSTVSLRVDTLIRLGLIGEVGDEDSRGGRRARRLELVTGTGFVAALDVGASHVSMALADASGAVLAMRQLPAVLDQDAEASIDWLWQTLDGMIRDDGRTSEELLGIAIGFPAPVEYPSGRLVLPSFMPSWHNAVIPAYFAKFTQVPVLVENDANLVALAERSEEHSNRDQLLAVKLGTRIGCGIISAGRLHRGVGGAAGEISHTAVSGVSTISCTCGIPNCLESVASGGAIAARLAQQGYQVGSAADVVALGQSADPRVTNILREAGTHIGEVLSAIVNFMNPRDVVLAGSMSAVAPLVAAIRAQLFQRCLPLVTEHLEVRASRSPGDAAIRGATQLILEEVFAPARVESLARALTGEAAQARA